MTSVLPSTLSVSGLALASLPLAMESAIVWRLHRRTASWSGELDLAGAIVLAGLATVCWAVAGSLLLSVANALAPLSIGLWWAFGCSVALYLARRDGRRSVDRGTMSTILREMDLGERVAAIMLLVVLVSALAMALCAPPNNADSLKYHLTRQLFWITHHTVFLHSAPFPHMLTQPPLAEYLGVNLMLLSGSDRLNNLIQFSALLHCLATIALLLREAGATVRAVLLGCLFLASYPAAFFEASNTKNDLVLSFFVLGVLWVLSGAASRRRFELDAAIALGAFTGCAMLTKGTAVAFLAVLGCYGAFALLRQRVPLRPAAIALTLVLAMLIPFTHYVRQAGTIAAAESGNQSQHVNAAFDPASATSVLLRNLATQMLTPWAGINDAIATTTVIAHERLGRPIDDPATTFLDERFSTRYTPTEEDRPPAPWHFLMLLLMPFGALALRARAARTLALRHATLGLLSLIAFSWLFRWQPWHARLLIPSIAIAAPAAGVVLGAIPSNIPRFAALALLLVDWWPGLALLQRPLFGPGSVFITAEPDLLDASLGEDADVIDSIGRILVAARPDSLLVDTGNASVYPALRGLIATTGNRLRLYGPSEAHEAIDAELVYRGIGHDPIGPATHGLVPVLSVDGWQLSMTPELQRAVSDPALYPRFFGFIADAGIGALQGPYPQYGLPRFRNAHFPAAVVTIPAVSVPRTVWVELLPYDDTRQTATIRRDGIAVATIEFAAPSVGAQSVSIELPADEQPHRLRIEFAVPIRSDYDPEPIGARLMALRVTPSRPDVASMPR